MSLRVGTANKYPFIAITVTGFAGTAAQILILRELLVLFYGNELSTGLVFASWMLCSAAGSGLAGRLSERMPLTAAVLSCLLTALSLLLPLSILWIRAARIVWSIPRGELVSPALMLGLSFSAVLAYCILSGFLFTFTWAALAAESRPKDRNPIVIYLGEALGAALGGIVFYFVLLPHCTALGGAAAISLVVLAIAAWLRQPWQEVRSLAAVARSTALVVSAAVLILIMVLSNVDAVSRRWQWGPHVLAVRDSPYQNLAVIEDAGQFSLFGNGLWLFSVPDPQSAEHAVHLALLQQRSPTMVLLISGGAAGLAMELLKYTDIERIDYVEPDPEVIRVADAYLPQPIAESMKDPRVRMFHVDASSFVRQSTQAYDVILLNVGDPMNAEMNRFYTLEFFRRLKRLLNPGGVVSFAVSSSPNIIGPAQARLLRSLYATACKVFSHVLVVPGEAARFLATDQDGVLVSDAQELIRRIGAKDLDLQYVREYYLFDFLSPMRLDYMRAVLERPPLPPANRDFVPTCYYNDLMLWAAQLSPFLQHTLTALTDIPLRRFGSVLGIILLGCIACSWSGRGAMRLTFPCLLSVTVMGGAQMALEIALLLSFQILQGFVYTQLALIISFFMAGMALGAGIWAVLSRKGTSALSRRRWLLAVQAIFACFVIGVLMLLFHLQQQLQSAVPSQNLPPVVPIFTLAALAAGLLGGLHFSLAVEVLAGEGVASGKIGGGLYALDLIGAAAGALAVSLFLLPVYGLVVTLLTVALTSLASAAALVKPRGSG